MALSMRFITPKMQKLFCDPYKKAPNCTVFRLGLYLWVGMGGRDDEAVLLPVADGRVWEVGLAPLDVEEWA